MGLSSTEKVHYREILNNNNSLKLNENSPSIGLILSNHLAKALSPKKDHHGLEFLSSQNLGSNFFCIIEDQSFRCIVDDDVSDSEDLSVNYKKLQQYSTDKKFISI